MSKKHIKKLIVIFFSVFLISNIFSAIQEANIKLIRFGSTNQYNLFYFYDINDDSKSLKAQGGSSDFSHNYYKNSYFWLDYSGTNFDVNWLSTTSCNLNFNNNIITANFQLDGYTQDGVSDSYDTIELDLYNHLKKIAEGTKTAEINQNTAKLILQNNLYMKINILYTLYKNSKTTPEDTLINLIYISPENYDLTTLNQNKKDYFTSKISNGDYGVGDFHIKIIANVVDNKCKFNEENNLIVSNTPLTNPHTIKIENNNNNKKNICEPILDGPINNEIFKVKINENQEINSIISFKVFKKKLKGNSFYKKPVIEEEKNIKLSKNEETIINLTKDFDFDMNDLGFGEYKYEILIKTNDDYCHKNSKTDEFSSDEFSSKNKIRKMISDDLIKKSFLKDKEHFGKKIGVSINGKRLYFDNRPLIFSNITSKISIKQNGISKNESVEIRDIALISHKIKKLKNFEESQQLISNIENTFKNKKIYKNISSLNSQTKVDISVPNLQDDEKILVYFDKSAISNISEIIVDKNKVEILDMDPLISFKGKSINYELPGNEDLGVLILLKMPIVFNSNNLIFNYRKQECDINFEKFLFRSLNKSGGQIANSQKTNDFDFDEYNVCVSHYQGLNFNVKNDISVNDFYNNFNIFESNDGFYNLFIKDVPEENEEKYSCLGSVDELRNKFGDCKTYEDNRIWIYLGQDNINIKPKAKLEILSYFAKDFKYKIKVSDSQDFNLNLSFGKNFYNLNELDFENNLSKEVYSYTCPDALKSCNIKYEINLTENILNKI